VASAPSNGKNTFAHDLIGLQIDTNQFRTTGAGSAKPNASGIDNPQPASGRIDNHTLCTETTSQTALPVTSATGIFMGAVN
jgi:hypothetical protein